MAVSYNKLWKKLIDLEMSRTELRLKAGFSTKVPKRQASGMP